MPGNIGDRIIGVYTPRRRAPPCVYTNFVASVGHFVCVDVVVGQNDHVQGLLVAVARLRRVAAVAAHLEAAGRDQDLLHRRPAMQNTDDRGLRSAAAIAVDCTHHSRVCAGDRIRARHVAAAACRAVPKIPRVKYVAPARNGSSKSDYSARYDRPLSASKSLQSADSPICHDHLGTRHCLSCTVDSRHHHCVATHCRVGMTRVFSTSCVAIPKIPGIVDKAAALRHCRSKCSGTPQQRRSIVGNGQPHNLPIDHVHRRTHNDLAHAIGRPHRRRIAAHRSVAMCRIGSGVAVPVPKLPKIFHIAAIQNRRCKHRAAA